MISKPKGTIDLTFEDAKKWQYVNDLIDSFCEKYNYDYIRTPVMESSEIFHRGVGETSDIVNKETYDFKDRGNRDMTLRPEGTAGVIRSYIENKMYGNVNQPVKLYYNETMYRYERPQAGRNREFTQFGLEVIGSNDPYMDAEVISLPVRIYEALGLKNVKVKINSLGDLESRNAYKEALVNYLKPHINDLCEDCQNRFLKNPLRILDCKVDVDSEILKNIPKMKDYLNNESKKHFESVLNYLDVLEIDYEIKDNLVRGLDYYDHTVFEIEADIKDFGAQNVLSGGGRYNSLVKTLGGPDTPAVGFAMGLDRLLIALEKENINVPVNNSIDVYILYVNEDEKEEAIYLNQNLRLNGFISEIDSMNKSLKAQFKTADRLNAKYLVILNSDDLKNGEITIKDNKTKEQEKIQILDLVDYLDMHM